MQSTETPAAPEDPGRIIVRPTSAAIQLTRFTGPEDAILAAKIDEHGKQLNDGNPLFGQGKSAIKKRIDVALSALHSTAYTKVSF